MKFKFTNNILKIYYLMSVALVFLALPSYAAKYDIKIAVSTPPTFSYNIALEEFKKQVEEGSNGEISVTIYPSAQLGNEVETGKNVQLGTLEMTVISASNISPFYKNLQVLSVPYIFKSLSCGFSITDGKIGSDLEAELLKRSGIRVLGWYTFGMRQLFNSKRDVVNVSDLKGLKIRVPASKMLEATWRTLGAIPSPLPFPEVFNGLQQGVIDGDALPLASIHQFKFYEPARHISLANVAIGLATFVVSEKFLNKLPKDYQELIIKAGRDSALVNRNIDVENNKKAISFFQDQGIKIVEPNLEEFRSNLGPVMDMARESFGAELVDNILNSQSNC